MHAPTARTAILRGNENLSICFAGSFQRATDVRPGGPSALNGLRPAPVDFWGTGRQEEALIENLA
jgi:hypothetical protein